MSSGPSSCALLTSEVPRIQGSGNSLSDAGGPASVKTLLLRDSMNKGKKKGRASGPFV
jgi:hypothetical protein